MVTKTHALDLIRLYKIYKLEFDEVFFVVSNRGTSTETRIDPSYCQYDNVLCIEYEELQFESNEEVEKVVNNLTDKFRARFEVRQTFFFVIGVCEGVIILQWIAVLVYNSTSLEQTQSFSVMKELPLLCGA